MTPLTPAGDLAELQCYNSAKWVSSADHCKMNLETFVLFHSTNTVCKPLLITHSSDPGNGNCSNMPHKTAQSIQYSHVRVQHYFYVKPFLTYDLFAKILTKKITSNFVFVCFRGLVPRVIRKRMSWWWPLWGICMRRDRGTISTH